MDMFSQFKNKKIFSNNSLLRQSISGTIALIIITQIITILLFSTLILRPQLQRMTAIMASNIAIFSHTIEKAPPSLREQMFEELKSTQYIEILKSENPPNKDGPAPRIIEHVFMRNLAENLKTSQPEIIWRTDNKRKLWIQLQLGDESYWISSKHINFGPTGLTIFLFLIVVLASVLIAIIINRIILKPIDELKISADNFSLNNNLKLLEETGPDEILSLRRSFNEMLSRILNVEKSRNIVLAGISHDLRTPLSKLRLAIEMIENKDVYLKQTIERQLGIIENNISDFLTFARGFEHEKTRPVLLKNIINDIILEYNDAEIKYQNNSIDEEVFIKVESIKRAIRNIIENSIKYGVPPIIINTNLNNDFYTISFKDFGKGIDKEKISIICEPFVKLEDARNNENQNSVSSGLGLAIVDKIIKAHNGKIEFENKSNCFEVRLIIPKNKNLK